MQRDCPKYNTDGTCKKNGKQCVLDVCKAQLRLMPSPTNLPEEKMAIAAKEISELIDKYHFSLIEAYVLVKRLRISIARVIALQAIEGMGEAAREGMKGASED